MPKNDFTAQAGISLEQWKKDIATMTSSMIAVQKQGAELNQEMQKTSHATANAAKSAGFLAGSLKLIGGALAVRKVAQFGQAAAEMGVEINDAARHADVSAESFQQLQRATEGTLSKGEFTSAINSVTQALDAARGGIPEAADALQEIGVSIETISNGKADQAFLEIADRAGKAAQSVAQLNKVFGDNARAVKETVSGGGGAIRERMGASAVSAENAKAAKEAGRWVKGKWQGFMSGATNLIGEASSAVSGTGEYSEEGKKKWDNRFHEPKGKIEEKKKASSENIVDVAKSQKELLLQHQKTDVSLESQLRILLAESNVLADQIALSEKQNGVNSIATLQLRAQAHERTMAYDNIEHQILMMQRAAANTTAGMAAQIGNTKLIADLTKTRLDFELKIAQAIHERRNDVADELRKQQAIAELEARAADLLKTPKEKAAEDKERRKKEAAMRAAAQNDKNRKESEARDKAALDAENRMRKARGLPPLDALPGGASYKKSGERGSEATRKAIDDAIKRALPPAPPAPPVNQIVKNQTVTIQAVGQLKSI
jgi:hypothetical protein